MVRVSHEVMEQMRLDAGLAAEATVETFEQFYERTWDGMVRLARVLIDDAEDAVDVVQEAYSRVLPRWRHVRSDGTDAYVRAAVLNACRRHLRRQRLALVHRQRRVADAQLGADHVLDAVRQLRPDRRDIVLLRFYLDLSETEIANALRIPAGTVKSRLHRALRELEEALR